MAPTSKCLHLRMTFNWSGKSPCESEVERSIPLWGRTCTFQKGNEKHKLGVCRSCYGVVVECCGHSCKGRLKLKVLQWNPCVYVANVVWCLQSLIPLTEEVMFSWHFAFRTVSAVTCRLAHTLTLAVGWRAGRPLRWGWVSGCDVLCTQNGVKVLPGKIEKRVSWHRCERIYFDFLNHFKVLSSAEPSWTVISAMIALGVTSSNELNSHSLQLLLQHWHPMYFPKGWGRPTLLFVKSVWKELHYPDSMKAIDIWPRTGSSTQ